MPPCDPSPEEYNNSITSFPQASVQTTSQTKQGFNLTEELKLKCNSSVYFLKHCNTCYSCRIKATCDSFQERGLLCKVLKLWGVGWVETIMQHCKACKILTVKSHFAFIYNVLLQTKHSLLLYHLNYQYTLTLMSHVIAMNHLGQLVFECWIL